MEQRLSLVTLGVADVARARRFYEQGLGWTASKAGNSSVVFFQLGGMVLALFGRKALAEDARLAEAAGLAAPGGAGFGGIALAHNVRRREEVDAVLAEAASAGGRILKPAEDAFWGGYSGHFADPDGHVWEVAWNPQFRLRDDGGLELPD